MAQKKPSPENDHEAGEAPKTVTCKHCRYEYPAAEKRCSICGYPWPWLEKEQEPESGD